LTLCLSMTEKAPKRCELSIMPRTICFELGVSTLREVV
jgi:hypothetical protein